MAKVLQISINVIHSPLYETHDSIYEIVSKKEAIKATSEEIKRRIEENVPEGSGCSVVVAHKISEE